MSNETCKVCGRGPCDRNTPFMSADRHAAESAECYRLGYTRELAAREAAERDLALARGVGTEYRNERDTADRKLRAAEKENTRLWGEVERMSRSLNIAATHFRVVADADEADGHGGAAMRMRNVAEAADAAAVPQVPRRTSDNTALRQPEPCPPGCAEHGEQGS